MEINMSESDKLAWLVGFFEAEGSISLKVQRHHQKKTIISVYIQITNQVETPILLYHAIFGGNTYRDRKYYTWKLAGNAKVAQFLSAIKCLCLIKNKQVDLALRALEIQRDRGIGKRQGYSSDAMTELIAIKQDIMNENKKT